MDKVAGTLQMSMSINEMTDAAKVYVIQNGTQPTIEAVYQGMHSGSTAVDNASITEKDMAAYAPQIEHILQQIGRGELRIKRWQSGCLRMNCRSRLRIYRH